MSCKSKKYLGNTEHCFTASVCTEDQFKCGDGKCIDKEWKCDMDFDCDDHSDEHVCKAEAVKSSCIDTEWACLIEDQCILKNWKCDGDEDCFDGTDEKNCKNIINVSKAHTIKKREIYLLHIFFY